MDFTGGSANDIVKSSNFTTGSLNIVDGGDGNDVLTASSNGAALAGQNGDDTLHGGGAYDVLDGGTGNDIIYGGGNPGNLGTGKSLAGGAGDDTIYGDLPGRYNVSGGDGNDIIDLSNAGVGSPTFGGSTVSGGNGDDTITGSAGSDSLNGNAGTDTIFGGDGNDLVTSADNQGPDFLDGGTGFDRSGDHQSLIERPDLCRGLLRSVRELDAG